MLTNRSTGGASYAAATKRALAFHARYSLPAGRGALRLGRGRPFRRHHAFLEQLGEDAGGVQAVQAADGVEVLEADRAVDLRQHEAGARIEVEPDDLVRGQEHDRPREVVQRDQLVRSGRPGGQLVVLRGRDRHRLLVDGPCAAGLGLGARRRRVLRDGHRGTVVPRAFLRRRLGLHLRLRRIGGEAAGRLAGRVRRHLPLRGGRRKPGMRSLQRRGGRSHVGVDPLQRAAQELARAQVGRLQRVRLLPGAHRLQHAPLAIVVEALQQQRGEVVLLGRRRRAHELPPRGETRPRSTAPRSAPSMRSRRSMLDASPTVSFCWICSLATLSAASARCTGSWPGPSAAACFRRGHSSSNCRKTSSARALCLWNSGSSFCPSIHSSLALVAVLISSSVRPELAVTVMLCRSPVCTSSAETETMPSALMSKMTSMSTSPRFALRSPVIMNSPSSSFWAAISLSPCSTVIFAEVWSSLTVVKTWWALVGTVVFFGMMLWKKPPAMAMPSECGVTSRSSISCSWCINIAPWMAAPSATASSGFTALEGSRPNICRTRAWMSGMRVWPPTSSTSPSSVAFTFASAMTRSQTPRQRSTRSRVRTSSWGRVSEPWRWSGPAPWAVAMKGRLISTCCVLDSSHLAFSAASR